MKYFSYLMMLSCIGMAMSAPMDSCVRQSNCLHVTQGECNSNLERTVCVKWLGGADCQKDPSDTVSHSCPVLGNVGDSVNTKIDGWSSNSTMCVTVVGGNSANFGVKDGSSCSAPGSYPTVDGSTGTCSGPFNVCDGNNVKECLWSFSTDVCVPPPTTQPPTTPQPTPACDNFMCNIEVPCHKMNDILQCANSC